MSANSELKLYTIRVILATGLVQGCSMAKLDYGAIQPPPSPTLERLAEQDGALFHWLSAFEGVPVYSDPRCMKERGRITFLDEYHELWRNDTTVLLAEATDGGTTVSKIVGYAKRENLINSYERLYYCLHAQNRIARKVLVVKGWDGDLVSKKSMGFRHMPDAAAPIQGSVNLYDILYVYALKGDPNDPNGFCLVGNRPICDVGDFSTRQKCFLGWLTNKQVLFWDHREGVELNKSPDALAWRKEHMEIGM